MSGLRTLRGHHVLCVHGFQGMGYSPDFIKKMEEIVEEIRDHSQHFAIRVIIGLDDACGSCPNRGEGFCNASRGSDEHVKQLDRRIMDHIGITDGESVDKHELLRRTAEKVCPEDLDVLCKGCSWLPYGVCKAGIAKLREERLT